MFICVVAYLQSGIPNIENSDKIKRKHIRLNFSAEFIDWWDGYIENGAAEWKAFRDMYAAFLVSNNMEKRDFSQKRFTAAIIESCDRFNRVLEKRRQGFERLLEYRVLPTTENGLKSDTMTQS